MLRAERHHVHALRPGVDAGGQRDQRAVLEVARLLLAAGRIKAGDRLLMAAFGAGFTAGAAVVEWTADPARALLAPGDQSRMGRPRETAEVAA